MAQCKRYQNHHEHRQRGSRGSRVPLDRGPPDRGRLYLRDTRHGSSGARNKAGLALPLVQPTRRDIKGMANGPSKAPILRIRKVKPKPVVPPVLKKAAKDFAMDIWKGSDRRGRR